MSYSIRAVDPDVMAPAELARLGDLVVESYRAIGALERDDDYVPVLRDVGRRAREAIVLAAFDDDAGGRALGCVTYVPDPANPWAEHLREGEASFRMLAVDRSAQGRGLGDRLIAACVERARAAGRRGLFLHSLPVMTTAQRLYARHGFVAAPERDWYIGGLHLMAFTLAL